MSGARASRPLGILLAVGHPAGARPASRPLRAWLLAQAAVYALASWAALKGAVTTMTPIPWADLDPRTSAPWVGELVLVVGLVLAGTGVILICHGARSGPGRDLLAASPRLRRAMRRVGQVGKVTRGIMFLLPGMLLVAEAWTYRRGSFGQASEGVRAALQEPWGRLLLVVAAIGLAAFAAYELAAAIYRREPADDAVASVRGRARLRPLWMVATTLVGGGAVLWAGLVVLGRVVEALSPPSGHGTDQAVPAWFAGHRTSELDRLSAIGSALASTMTCITVAAVVAVVFVLWLGRWRESAVLVLAITGQLLIFVLATGTVHRLRPAVAHLDPAPPTSSFPSGHAGAAVALYGCVALIVLRELRWQHRRTAVALAAVLAVVPLAVGLSRMYRGMHFPTDVLAGAATGAGWLGLVVAVVLLPGGRLRPAPEPDAGRRLKVPA
jgi:membrane-associated phospholipid phosphatase